MPKQLIILRIECIQIIDINMLIILGAVCIQIMDIKML